MTETAKTPNTAPPSAATPPLEIRLFGRLEVLVHGVALPPLRTRLGYYLLALLVLRGSGGQETPRSYFAGLLWPDSLEEQALSSLRRALTDLRQALGDEAGRILSPTPRTLALDLTGDAFADVLAFDRAGKRSDGAGHEEMVALYRGELLEGWTEDWVIQERTPREEAFLDALEGLAEDALAADHAHEAVQLLRRAVTINPWRETAQRTLLRALAAVGDHAGLTLAYREFRLALRREMNSEPNAETSALYNRLRGGRSATSTPTTPRPAPVSAEKGVGTPILARPLTTLIGRERETQEVLATLSAGRLVTLSGPAGVGKTRLALSVAEQARPAFPDGVAFVELAPLSDPILVPEVVATSLGLREGDGGTLRDALRNHLATQDFLLILDNCEHLVDACAALITELLAACPGVRILATSRHALGVEGEAVWRVPPLEIPGSDSDVAIDKMLGYEAVSLFVDRALAAHSRFALTPANAATVAHICRHLDGIPLAIELAAPLTRAMTVEQIASRLQDRFRLLSSARGGTGRPAHQQTLLAAMDWSYNLLTEPERLLLRRLSVFSGGCTLEAAHAVAGGEGDDEWDTIDLLTLLIDKSLVHSDDHNPAAVRYHILETVREYGRERLRESGEDQAIQTRFFAYFTEYAERIGPLLSGPDQGAYLDQVQAEHDNLRAILQRADNGTRLRILGELQRFWQLRGYFTEGRNYLNLALAGDNAEQVPDVHARAFNSAGVLAHLQKDDATARDYLTRAVAIYTEVGNREKLAGILNNLAMALEGLDDIAGAEKLYLQSLEINQECGNRNWEAINLTNLGALATSRGDLDAAQAYAQRSLEVYQSLNHQAGAASSLNNLGHNALLRGDFVRAIPLIKQALEINRVVGNRIWEATNLFNLSLCYLELGDSETARVYGHENLRIQYDIGLEGNAVMMLDLLAAATFLQGRGIVAARWWGAVITKVGGDLTKLMLEGSRESFYQRFSPTAKSALGEVEYNAAFTEGSTLPFSQIIAEAFRDSPTEG